MSESTSSRAPWHLWVVGIVSLLWNAVGAVDYFMTQTHNEAYLSQFTPEILEFTYSIPAWAVAFWAISVWGSVLGSILLLLRKKLAEKVFLVVIGTMLVTTFNTYGLSNGFEVMGDAFSITFTIVIAVVSVLLWWYAKKQVAAGVLQ